MYKILNRKHQYANFYTVFSGPEELSDDEQGHILQRYGTKSIAGSPFLETDRHTRANIYAPIVAKLTSAVKSQGSRVILIYFEIA